MVFAVDKNNKRIFIDNVKDDEKYFCPVCGAELVIKNKGKIKAHHFAHRPNYDCSDTWHYDMSPWHIRWQNCFPFEMQEIIKQKDGLKHRADVLIEDRKIVYEFQHSPMSPEEFEDRNSFYNALGYKVIWIFDVASLYEEQSIWNRKNNTFEWLRAKKTFASFNPKAFDNVELFLEIQNCAEDNEEIIEDNKALANGYNLELANCKSYYEDHKNDKRELIKVAWTPGNGLEVFCTDGITYTEADIIKKGIDIKPNNKAVRLGDLYDKLIELYSKDHTTYYFGCPKSTTHKCGSSTIDIPESKYNEIAPCVGCSFHSYDEDNNYICKKRFMDLELSSETLVEITKRNSSGFITQLSYTKDGETVSIDIPSFENNAGNTIFDLWRNNNYKIAIFRNVKTGIFVKITKDPAESALKYGKVYGYFSRDQFSFPEKSVEIYGCSDLYWICVWSVNK